MAQNRLAKLVLSLEADIAKYTKDMQDASATTQREVKKMSGALNSIQSSVKGLGTGLVAAIGVGSATQMAKLADQFNVLDQRIKTATRDTGDYTKVSAELFKISQKNGVALADTVSLFQNVSRGARELGATNTDILKFSNTLQQLGTIGGSSAEAMSRALTQLSQSMSGGVVRAEEYNSIVENMPELMHRIAVGMGKTDGQLRQLMLSGKLMSKDVLSTILAQSDEIDKQFKTMPMSMERAGVAMTNSMGAFVSKLDQALGLTKALVTAMQGISKEADGFGNLIAGLPSQKIKLGKQDASFGNIAKAGWNLVSSSFTDGMQNQADLSAALQGKMTWQQKQARERSRDFNRQYKFQREVLGLDEPAPEEAPKQKSLPKPTPAVDQKAIDKAKKKHETELKHSEQILANMRSQNEQLRAKLAGDDELLTKEKALLQISKDKTLSDKEKAKLSKEINKLAAEHAALVKQQKIGEEKEKLAGILTTLREKSVELKNQIGGQKELNVLAQAEKDIQDAVKVGKKETVAEQKQILATAQEVADLQAKLARQKVDKQINEDDQKFAEQIQKEMEGLDHVGQSLREQNELLRLKLAGQENLAKGLEMERQYQREITALKRNEAEAIRDIQNNENYTDDDKAKQVEKVRQGYKGVYEEAAKRHEIAKKEAETNLVLNKSLEDQQTLLDNIVASTGNYKQKLGELDKALISGQITQKQWQTTADGLWKAQSKANHTIGDSVKQIGNNMTQAILNGQKLTDVFKQMGKALASLAAQKLIFEPLANGIDNLAGRLFGTGKYTQRPTMPGMGGGGQIASGGGLGNLFGGGGPKWGGPENATDEILADQYEHIYNTGRDALGAPLQDLEYYYQLPRAEAARRLGIAGVDISGRRPSSGGMLGGLARSLGIPAFANGGMARGGQLALFGEQGPELAVPKSDMHVFTAAQTQGMLGFTGGGGGSGSVGWIAGGGGAITPEEYLGDWVPQHRRQLLTSIGFSGTGSEVLALMRAIQKEKNNYNKKALNEQLTNALFRREQDWQGLIGEYREFARAANYAGASKMVAEETAAGRGEGLAAMAGNAILSNAHFSHGIIAQGRIVPPRGNAVEDILEAAKLTGRMPSEALLKHLAALDAEAQDDYMPGHFLTPGAGYKSMSEVGQAGGMKVFGVDDAYGGDGRQAAVGDMLNAIRDERWANDAQNSYNRSMNNKNPLGSYKGASAEYLKNVKGWNKFPKNYAGPGMNSPVNGLSDYPGEGFALSNAGYVPTGATGDTNGWIDGDWTGSPNPSRFDPTVASKDYTPKLGNLKGWSDAVKNSPYLKGLKEMTGGLLSNLKKIGQSALKPFGGLSDSWQIPGKGLKTGGLMKDMLSSFNSWADGKGDFALNMGGLRGDLKSSASSWAYKGKGLKTGGLAGDLKDSLGSWLPKPAPYNGLFGTGPLFGDGDLKGLAAYSGPMLNPAMGIAMPPPMRLMHGRPPAAPQPFRGSLSPYADADYRYNFTRQYNDRYSTVGNSAFGRWQTDPFTAGRINARMVKSRANGGPLAAGDVSWVGERGPELIVPNKPSYVVPNHALGGKPELKVIVNNTVSDTTTSTVRETSAGTIIDIAEKVAQQAVNNTLGGVRRKR